jgi:hypothetical protein
VVGLGQAVERTAQVVERHARIDGGVGRRTLADELEMVPCTEPLVGVERDLVGAPRAAERVDARVLGDLVDPRLEVDRTLGLAHPAQGGHEDLLRDVLGPTVVLDHPVHVRRDAPLVAPVELLERAVVSCPRSGDERLVGGVGACPREDGWRGERGYGPLLLCGAVIRERRPPC